MTLAFIIVAVVTAALRLGPGLLWPRHAMDGGYHMLLRREIRRHGMRMPPRVDAMALDERQTYPWWFHYLLALLPEAWLRRAPPLPSTLIDTAHALLVANLAAHLAPVAAPSVDPAAAALVAGLLFATAPALLVVGIGPRAYEITPRPFGELCYTLAMAAAGAYATGGPPWTLAIAAVAAGIALMSSKFAAQVLLLCAPAAALIAKSWIPVLLVPVALAAAIILSGGRYRWVLAAQIRHLAIFRRRLQHEHSILRDRNRWSALARAFLNVLRAPGNATARADFARLAEHNTVLQFLLRNVLWCATILLVVLGVSGDPLPPALPASPASGTLPAFEPWPLSPAAYFWFLGWAVAPIVPFVLSSLRAFRYLGEAERYPEYAVPAVAVLAALGTLTLPRETQVTLLLLYIATLLPPIVYSLARQRWNALRAAGPGFEGVIHYLRTEPSGSGVLPIPWFAAYALAPELEHRFFAGNDTNVWYRDYERIFARYPWPTTDLDYWRGRGAALALVEWPLLDADADAPPYPLSGLPLAYTDARFRVYRLG